MCNHQNAKCVESTPVQESGRFEERYECACGATGAIYGREDEPPAQWQRVGEVFQ